MARHNLLHLMDAARSLRSPEALAQRKLILLEPRMAPLRKYVNGLRAKYALAEREFPDFDPMDGACQARILLLIEKPGPMTSAAAGNGSGFISRNNDDPTAEATFSFMRQAGIPRERSIPRKSVVIVG